MARRSMPQEHGEHFRKQYCVCCTKRLSRRAKMCYRAGRGRLYLQMYLPRFGRVSQILVSSIAVLGALDRDQKRDHRIALGSRSFSPVRAILWVLVEIAVRS